MILSERESGAILATDALQWLRRGLHFIYRFFQYVLEDKEENENLGKHMKTAYEETLKRYHGWVGTKLFNVRFFI